MQPMNGFDSDRWPAEFQVMKLHEMEIADQIHSRDGTHGTISVPGGYVVIDTFSLLSRRTNEQAAPHGIWGEAAHSAGSGDWDLGTNLIDTEFTQCRVFVAVKRSPWKT